MVESLFNRLPWQDPITLRPLEVVVTARTPGGVPLCGALRIRDTDTGYPIVDAVARLTPELASRHRAWLALVGLRPPEAAGNSFQDGSTVESFGFQWAWNAQMRTEKDLRWRVSERFRVPPERFQGTLVLDAGAGAGDQSRWMLDQGANVVSLDLSTSIDVVASKLRNHPNWVGVQGDLSALPWAGGAFGLVYCEGVIQHTRDSALTVAELGRVVSRGGIVLATHYARGTRLLSRAKVGYMGLLRRWLARWERYKLLLLTGNLAALSYVPLVGRLVRGSGTAVYSDLMPDFKTTWTNTFDSYGSHSYQHRVSAEEFWSYFAKAGNFRKVYSEDTTVVAERVE